MKTLKNYFLIALLGAAVMAGCRSDDDDAPCCDATNPECPNYDPCWDVDEPDAGFTMEEFILALQEWVSAGDDSVFFNEVRYTANYQDTNITHKWYLSSEVITEPTFTRTHATVPPSQRPTFINVSHVIEYPIDNHCYQSEVGRDSTSRTYYLIKYWNEYEILGNYMCAFENETDSFSLTLGIFDENGNDEVVFSSTGQIVGENFHNTPNLPEVAFTCTNNLLFFNGSASSTPRGFMRPTETFGLYKMEYRLFLNDYVVYARKLD